MRASGAPPSRRGALARRFPLAMAKVVACGCLALAFAAHRGRRAAAVLRGHASCRRGGRPCRARRPCLRWHVPRSGGPMNLSPHGRGFGTDFLPDTPPIAPRRRWGSCYWPRRRQFWVMVIGACHRRRGALFHYATSPKTFEASATLLIEEQRAELEQEISAALPTARNDTSMLNEMQILASLQVASDVVTTLVLTDNPAFPTRPQAFCRRVGGQGVCPRADPRNRPRSRAHAAPDADAERSARSCRPPTAQGQHGVSPRRAQLRGGDLVRLHDPRARRRCRERLCRRLYRRRHPRDGAIGR
jgi:hypothetical protein